MAEEINTQQEAGEKTFTQEDVNRIVSDRLAKEKGKADVALAEREAGLAAREKVLETREKLAGAGLPGELLKALTLYNDGELDKAVAILAKHYKQAQTGDGNIPAGMHLVENGAKPGQSRDGIPGRSNVSLRHAMGLE